MQITLNLTDQYVGTTYKEDVGLERIIVEIYILKNTDFQFPKHPPIPLSLTFLLSSMK